jgi:hypothetical protein
MNVVAAIEEFQDLKRRIQNTQRNFPIVPATRVQAYFKDCEELIETQFANTYNTLGSNLLSIKHGSENHKANDRLVLLVHFVQEIIEDLNKRLILLKELPKEMKEGKPQQPVNGMNVELALQKALEFFNELYNIQKESNADPFSVSDFQVNSYYDRFVNFVNLFYEGTTERPTLVKQIEDGRKRFLLSPPEGRLRVLVESVDTVCKQLNLKVEKAKREAEIERSKLPPAETVFEAMKAKSEALNRATLLQQELDKTKEKLLSVEKTLTATQKQVDEKYKETGSLASERDLLKQQLSVQQAKAVNEEGVRMMEQDMAVATLKDFEARFNRIRLMMFILIGVFLTYVNVSVPFILKKYNWWLTSAAEVAIATTLYLVYVNRIPRFTLSKEVKERVQAGVISGLIIGAIGFVTIAILVYFGLWPYLKPYIKPE